MADDLTSLALKFRDDPQYEKLMAAMPDIDHVMQDILGDQNKPINQASSPLEKAFSFGRTQDFAPTETNIFGALERPASAIRNVINMPPVPEGQSFGQAVDSAASRGFNRPREVPSIASTIPVQPGASEPQLWANAVAGAGADMATDPLSYVGVPGLGALGRFVGKGIERVAPDAVKWFANQTRNINPKLNARVNPPTESTIVDTFKPEPTPNIIEQSAVQPPADQTPEYQAWLQQNAQPSTPQNPAMDVPLHPAEEGRAQAAALVPPVQDTGPKFDVANINDGMPAPAEPPPLRMFQGSKGQMVFQTPKNKTPAPSIFQRPEVPAVPEQPFPVPAGQQEFDFTKGPSDSVVSPEPGPTSAVPNPAAEAIAQLQTPTPKPQPAAPENVIQQQAGRGLTPAAQRKMELWAIEDSGGKLTPKQKRELKVLEEANLPKGQPLSEENMIESSAQPKKIDIYKESNPLFVDPEKGQIDAQLNEDNLRSQSVKPPAPEVAARLQRMQDAKVKATISSLVKRQKAAQAAGDSAAVERLQGLIDEGYDILKTPAVGKTPTAVEDLITIIKGFQPQKGLHGAVPGLPPPMDLSPEGRAALDRFRTHHAPELAAYLKTAGNDVAGFIKSKLPNITPQDLSTATHYLTKTRLSNFNVNNLSPENAAHAKEIVSNNADLRANASDTPLGYQERVGRAGSMEAQAGAKALSEGEGRNIASSMDRLGIQLDDELSKISKSLSPKERSDAIENARAALDNFNKSGTAIARMLESRKHIIANIESYKAEAKVLLSEGQISQEEFDSFSEAAGKIGKLPPPIREKFWGMLHELGVNNMLSVMSNLRNIAGNTMMAPVAPLTRLAQGAINIGARQANKVLKTKGGKTFSGTDVYMREAPAMVKGYAKNIGTGMRLGGKYFQHETDSGVYRKIKQEIEQVTADTKMNPKAKAAKLQDLQKQKEYVVNTIKGLGGDMSSRDVMSLSHRRQIPGELGKHVNTMTRGLSAMDKSFRYPMDQGAEAAIRKRMSIKNNIPLDQVKWTPAMAEEAATEGAYYTFNEALDGVARKMQAAAQPKTAGGYVGAQILVFMKNAINIGKVALDHGALNSGNALLDYSIGPILNRLKKGSGSHALLDTKALARSAAGLGLTYTSYAAFKKAGWQFYPATDITDTATSQERQTSKVPTGVFAVDPSGKVHDLSQSQPATMFFNKMAAWDEVKRLRAKGTPESDVAFKNLKSQMAAWLDSSMMTGTRDVYNTWDKVMKLKDPEARSDDMNPAMSYLSKQAAARLVPAFLDEINRTWGDKTARDPNNAGEYFKQRVPGLSKSVPPRVDWKGQEMQRLPSANPLREMTVGSGNLKNTDPVDQELLRLGVSPQPVAKSINGLPVNKTDRRSIRQEWGPRAYEAISKEIETESYKQLPEFMKASVLTSLLKMQGVGEKVFNIKDAVAHPNEFFKRSLDQKTKGRSFTGDNSQDLIYSK